jgi:hypothetical protein
VGGKVKGTGYRLQVTGCRVQGTGYRVQVAACSVQLVACRGEIVTEWSFANPRLNIETWGTHFRDGANEILATGH